ncbi:restriction endonuclease [Pseudoalteromonas lipolytica]|uniref:nSTAND3 domain-containing NTPase n=1 Tax=Pseudoalteromonas lipolytica TaxID=570156 RepID=UPI0008252D3D|nr:restriction endonuclease [Pseudoalteromonas lipolytica]
MHDYKFHTLSPRDFEYLSNDLVGAKLKVDVRSFATGRDKGIDGWLIDKNQLTVVQSKHWENTKNSVLISRLRNDELPKIKKLKPKRYILSVSNDLTVDQVKQLINDFKPYLKEDDLLDRGKINKLISENPSIEANHYKLWFSSTNILNEMINSDLHNQTQFELEEIKKSIKTYVRTRNYYSSKNKLDQNNCIIITGAPGVGKTTLSRVLVHELIVEEEKRNKSNYEFIYIDCINDFNRAYKSKLKQIFLFDDFLGRNYLSEVRNSDDRKLKEIIDRIRKSANKKLILTSRVSILNQAKNISDDYDSSTFISNEELIDVSDLSRIEKAKILSSYFFNTMSTIKETGECTIEIEDFTNQDFYLKIIDHRNYNPRLIEHILNKDNFNASEHTSFKNFSLAALNNPSKVWEKPIKNNLNDIQREILYSVIFTKERTNQEKIYDLTLKNNNIKSQEFFDSLKVMNESFISISIDSNNCNRYIKLLNPSIADFLIPKLINESPSELASLIVSMGSLLDIYTLPNNMELKREKNKYINKHLFFKKLVENLKDKIKFDKETITLSIYALKNANSEKNNCSESLLLDKIIENTSTITQYKQISEILEITKKFKHSKEFDFEKLSKEHLDLLDDHGELADFSFFYNSNTTDWHLDKEIEYKAIEYWSSNLEEKLKSEISSVDFINDDIIDHYNQFDEVDEESVTEEIYDEVEKIVLDICNEYDINIHEDGILSCFDIDSYSESLIDEILNTLENTVKHEIDENQGTLGLEFEDEDEDIDDEDSEDDEIRNLFY